LETLIEENEKTNLVLLEKNKLLENVSNKCNQLNSENDRLTRMVAEKNHEL
jgi:hypothetical protein